MEVTFTINTLYLFGGLYLLGLIVVGYGFFFRYHVVNLKTVTAVLLWPLWLIYASVALYNYRIRMDTIEKLKQQQNENRQTKGDR